MDWKSGPALQSLLGSSIKLPGGYRSVWEVSGACFGKGTRKQPLTHSSTSTAMQNRWRNADDNRASMKREKNRYKPPVCFMICLYWNHIFLHNQNRILLQIRVLNLKASCKVQEGWKKKYKKGAFSFHHDLQPKPQEQSKPLLLGLGRSQIQLCCYTSSVENLIKKAKKAVKEEVHCWLPFSCTPHQKTSFYNWQSKSAPHAFSKCSEEHWLRRSIFLTPVTSASQTNKLPHTSASALEDSD